MVTDFDLECNPVLPVIGQIQSEVGRFVTYRSRERAVRAPSFPAALIAVTVSHMVRSAPGAHHWDITPAVSHRDRGRGLLGRAGLGRVEGLWLPVRSVHTVGMRFRLDLVWLDRDGDVVRVDPDVGPGRIRTCLAARGGVVEVAAGRGAALADELRRAVPARVSAARRRGPRPGTGWPGRRAGRPSR
jgi:uncharacterized membrane protein (UPF0127 family)